MKILHILRSEAWGGLELYTLEFIQNNNSNNTNNKTFLLCKKNSRLEKEAKERGIPVLTKWYELFKKWDVYHVHQRQDLLLTRLALLGRPKPCFYYSLMMNAPLKKKWHHNFIYSRVNGLMTSSVKVMEDVKNNFPIQSSKVYHLPYGRVFPELKSETPNEFYKNKKEGRVVFGTLCRLDRGKGLVELVSSLDYLSEQVRDKIQIWIMGEPTLKKIKKDQTPIYEDDSLQVQNFLLEYQNKYPDQILLFGYHKNPWPFLECLDVYVVASYEETYSLSVLDAMSLGKPVLGTQSGGTTEQIGEHQERGYWVTPRSAESLAQGIQRSLADDSFQSKGQVAKCWVKNLHSWENNKNLLKKIYSIDFIGMGKQVD